jgi:predicted DNA-binding protein (MmcQ/YjbR family)
MTPFEVYKKIVLSVKINPQLRALDGIDSKYMERAQWIIEYKQKRLEEEKIKAQVAAEYKLKMLDDKDELG